MAAQVIAAPEYVDVSTPIIFLAGPIQGAYDWQSDAIKLIQRNSPYLHIANPRRPGEAKGNFSEKDYGEQVDWETYYLRRAAKDGAIMFWLAKEFEHKCERAYAQTSRFELGEWKIRHERDGIKLVIGIEEGFTNKRYITRRLSQDCPNINICSSLEETCNEVGRLFYQW